MHLNSASLSQIHILTFSDIFWKNTQTTDWPTKGDIGASILELESPTIVGVELCMAIVEIKKSERNLHGIFLPLVSSIQGPRDHFLIE